ncbi:MAG TPA: hypothetical protein VL860_12715 [Planctomycetota bacterium]|jgi:hypothetical protein|nr:hypothetical protein [Planctomycetota bacterium]
MAEPENMHGIHSQPVTPHHHYAPVNSVRPANAPQEASAEGLHRAHEKDYSLLVGAFLVALAVYVGLLCSNYLYTNHYAEITPANAQP